MRFYITLSLLVTFGLSFGQLSINKINTRNNDPNEPTVAIDPNNSQRIVAGANTDNFYYSDDAGKSWHEFTATSDLGIYGDPVLHYSENKLFFTHLSKTKGKVWGDWFDRIVVQQINDVEAWDEKSYSVGFNEPKMQDKPWLSSYKDSVYVTWTEFDHYDQSGPEFRSRIQFSFYDPIEDEFSHAVTISDTTGDCNDGDSTLEGATTGVGPLGEIYCVWSGFNNLYFDKSNDGGISWGTDKIISDQPKGWNMEMPNIFRANGMPFVQCDTKNDIIYVCWADELNGNADVWLLYSEDKGETWSERIKLNLDETSGHQYFPIIDLDEESGKIYAAFYDQRNSTLAAFYDLYIAEYSREDGVKNFRVTPKSIPLPGSSYFYGDYIDIDVTNGAVALIYPSFDTKNKSSIQVAYSPNVDNLSITATPETQLATLTDEGKTTLIVNVQSRFKLRGRITVGHFFNNKTYLIQESYKGDSFGFDQIVGKYNSIFSTKIKYKLINLDTGEKTKYKGKLSNLF